jgi:hypothetical protein
MSMKFCSKRPCRICAKWFMPNPRIGNRQKVCHDPACQREWHRKNCQQWHRKHASSIKEQKIKKLIRPNAVEDPIAPSPSDFDFINWNAIDSLLDKPTKLVLLELFQVTLNNIQHSINSQ